jgi:hypothetical protein
MCMEILAIVCSAAGHKRNINIPLQTFLNVIFVICKVPVVDSSLVFTFIIKHLNGKFPNEFQCV